LLLTGTARPSAGNWLLETRSGKAPRSTYGHLNKQTRQWATFFYTPGKPFILIEKLEHKRLDGAGISRVFKLFPSWSGVYQAMSPSFLKTKFRKTIECPSSQKLLGYRRQTLLKSDNEMIESHLSKCDFCSAELQLLSRHRNVEENYRLVEIPVQLRRLAEDLLFRQPKSLAARKPGDHLLH